jgi:hypothetical protein
MNTPELVTSNELNIEFQFASNTLKLQTRKQDVTNVVFYNATSIFKGLDLPPSQEPDKWLRAYDTKQFMVKNCDKINPLTKDVQMQNLFNQASSDGQGRMERLSRDIEQHFTFQIRGRTGGTYMRKELFLKYASYLDKHLEWCILDVFQKYGHLERLKGEEKVSALLDVATNEMEEVITSNTGNKPQKQRTLARLDGMIKQKALQQILATLICDLGIIRDNTFTENFFRDVYNSIYIGCFGQDKYSILDLLERKTGLIRDFMSDDALDILSTAESLIQARLNSAKRAGIQMDLRFIKKVVFECCKIASGIPFDYKKEMAFLTREPNKKFKKRIKISMKKNKHLIKVTDHIL